MAKPDPIYRAPSQAADQRGKKCHRPALAAVVPWLHGQGRSFVPAVHRRQGRGPVQTPGPRAGAGASGHQPGTDDRRAGPISAGMGDGRATSVSASCTSCHRWTAGSAGACVASSGSSGRRAISATANSVVSMSPSGRPTRPSSAQRYHGGQASRKPYNVTVRRGPSCSFWADRSG